MSTVEAFDAAALRKITQKALDVAADIASFTPSPTDDLIVAQAKKIVDSDIVWTLLGRYIFHSVSDQATQFPTSDGSALHAAIAAELPGIDPLSILAIINLALPVIKSLWELWQKRHQPTPPTPVPDPTPVPNPIPPAPPVV